MSLHSRLDLARVKMVRYRILKILDAGYPYPVGEGLMVEVLADADLRVTQMEARKALQYLSDKGYVSIEEPKGGAHWEAQLLPKGVDYIQNPDLDDDGIARPGQD